MDEKNEFLESICMDHTRAKLKRLSCFYSMIGRFWLCFSILPFTALNAVQYFNITFESPAYLELTPGSGSKSHWYHESGNEYDLPSDGVGSTESCDPDFSGNAHSGQSALCLQLLESSGSGSDRSEFRAVHGSRSEVAPRFGQKNYFRFNLLIDGSSTEPLPNQEVIFMQLWQRKSGGSNLPDRVRVIPFHMRLKDTGSSSAFTYEMVSRLPNGQIEGAETIIGTGTIAKDAWQKFVVMVIPSHTSDGISGKIAVWQNDSQVAVRNSIDYGVPPETGSNWWVGNTMDLRVGLYRGRQNSRQVIYIDDIRYGDNLGDVN